MSPQATEPWNAWTTRRDERAFEDLVRPELPHVLGFARRLGCSDADAADALQDALVRLVQVRDDTPGAVGVRAWLCREVHVRARSRLRAERRRYAREAAASVAEARTDAAPALDAREEVERALAALASDEREAVELRYLHDLDYGEMALVLGVSEGACRKRVHRALTRLRERFGRDVAALVAALPLPAVRDASSLVRNARAPTAAPVTSGGVLIMATTGKKMAAAAVLAFVAGVGTTLAVQPAGARDGGDPEADRLAIRAADGDGIAERDAEIASLRRQLAAALQAPPTAKPQVPSPPNETAGTVPVPLRSLDAIDWERLGAMLLRARKADEPDAEAMGEIGRFLGTLGSMKDELGGGSPMELVAHPEVQSRVVAGIAKALRPELRDDERCKLQEQVRDAVAALRRDRPRDVVPLLRMDYDVSAGERINEILASHVGKERAADAEGLTFGTGGNMVFGREYISAATQAEIAQQILSYWTERVVLDGERARAAERIAASWAAAFVAVRERAVGEFGAETVCAALSDAPDDDAADPLGAVRRVPAYPSRHRTIFGRVRAMQAKHENELFQTLTPEERKAYARKRPDVLLFSAER